MNILNGTTTLVFKCNKDGLSDFMFQMNRHINSLSAIKAETVIKLFDYRCKEKTWNEILLELAEELSECLYAETWGGGLTSEGWEITLHSYQGVKITISQRGFDDELPFIVEIQFGRPSSQLCFRLTPLWNCTSNARLMSQEIVTRIFA